jgi:hypothetical protein
MRQNIKLLIFQGTCDMHLQSMIYTGIYLKEKVVEGAKASC